MRAQVHRLSFEAPARTKSSSPSGEVQIPAAHLNCPGPEPGEPNVAISLASGMLHFRTQRISDKKSTSLCTHVLRTRPCWRAPVVSMPFSLNSNLSAIASATIALPQMPYAASDFWFSSNRYPSSDSSSRTDKRCKPQLRAGWMPETSILTSDTSISCETISTSTTPDMCLMVRRNRGSRSAKRLAKCKRREAR